MLSVASISHDFYNKAVLSDISFTISSGESLVILGPSGTGKSVLLKIIAKLISPTSGHIDLDGSPYNHKDLGMVFQHGALFSSLSIWENVSFFLRYNTKITKQEAMIAAEQALLAVGLDSSVLYLYPHELSGGMQRRVAIARTIIKKPKLLLFDEPTTGLDPFNTNVINETISHQFSALASTTITVTHDLKSALFIAHKIAFMHNGALLWFGMKDEMYSSDCPEMQQFLASCS